ncbi:ATP-grasp domain-containing protein [Lentzea albidocapillata]|uniref:ATP-grasp domain-containing protein n=1 Tax=Lentzea albidocapillata TaxID=40571 RepID=A0A1W2CUL8_9PSEU|nr:ATP-grasp domain-containing protein [Lentzea albidocapillata]SMC88913.1 ATP-grasp domain-containing protein [Lentzea albidocapillata]
MVIQSSHHTLVRDRRLADELRVLGFDVASQSHASVAIGADKVLMKRFLDRHGFATPRWSSAARWGLGADTGHQVVKARHGTQSENTRLALPGERPSAPDVLHEEYEPGTEYSVIVHRDGDRVITFPPVWKGRTSLDLVPPWRRLRLCPYHRLPEPVATEMHHLSTAIADAADTCGYLEIEYLVTDKGAVTVLELNPRISGTMRIVAMATNVMLFSSRRLGALPDRVFPVRWAAEVPYGGEHFSAPEDQVFATSRLTVASDDPAQLREKLVRFGGKQTDLHAAAFQVA